MLKKDLFKGMWQKKAKLWLMTIAEWLLKSDKYNQVQNGGKKKC